jgi:hypothetical protein
VVNGKRVRLQEKWKINSERNRDESLCGITDNVRMIGVLRGAKLVLESVSGRGLGAVGLEPTKS